MSGWATTILAAGSSRRNDRDLSLGTEMTREGAASLSIASALAGEAARPAARTVSEAQSAVARLRDMVMDSAVTRRAGAAKTDLPSRRVGPQPKRAQAHWRARRTDRRQ